MGRSGQGQGDSVQGRPVEQLQARGINPRGGPRPADKAGWEAANKLAEEFGFYEYPRQGSVRLRGHGRRGPRRAVPERRQGRPRDCKDRRQGQAPAPRLSVYVKCESPGQLLGDGRAGPVPAGGEQPFALNFLKGMVGLWCRLCIVIGLAVACSTYLSGVLSLLVTAVIFIFGFFPPTT